MEKVRELAKQLCAEESLSGRGDGQSRGAEVGVCCQAVGGQVIGAKRIWVGDEVLEGPTSRALQVIVGTQSKSYNEVGAMTGF